MLNFKLVKYENRLGARHFIQIRLPPCFIVTQLSFHCDPALTAPTLRSGRSVSNDDHVMTTTGSDVTHWEVYLL